MSKNAAADETNQEMRFLQKCLQSRFHADALDGARQIVEKGRLDWERVQQLAEQERIGPLLYSLVRDKGLLPRWYEKLLRNTYIQYGFHNAQLLQNFQTIVREFATAEIPLIALKGAALAESVYGNIAVRPMVDLDVLIHERDIDRALHLLKRNGYLPADPEVHPGMITAYENELLLHKLGRFDIALELHWSLLDSPHYQQKIGMDWFWQSARSTQLGGSTSLVLGPEATLLHLCSHVMLHHRGGGLLWLQDIAEVLIRFRSTIDWSMLIEKAEAYDLVLPLRDGVTRVNEFWALDLSQDILHELDGLQPSEREQQVVEWLTSKERPVAKRFWVDLATSDSWSRRLEYAWRNLFPQADYMRQRYKIRKPYLLPLYYPYRWLRGLASLFHN